jgi:hypothetical protein
MQEAEIQHTGRTHIELDVPIDFPVGRVIVTVKPKSETVEDDGHVNRAAEICGMGKGKVWVSDDFDDPLDDFAEYM